MDWCCFLATSAAPSRFFPRAAPSLRPAPTYLCLSHTPLSLSCMACSPVLSGGALPSALPHFPPLDISSNETSRIRTPSLPSLLCPLHAFVQLGPTSSSPASGPWCVAGVGTREEGRLPLHPPPLPPCPPQLLSWSRWGLEGGEWPLQHKGAGGRGPRPLEFAHLSGLLGLQDTFLATPFSLSPEYASS